MKKEYNSWNLLLLMLVGLFCLSACTQQSSLTFYVDSTATVATGDGSVEHPFASPLEVRDAIRSMKSSGALTGVKRVHVVFADGVYVMKNTLTLDQQDVLEGGRIIYEAANKGKAVLTLSDEISNKDFTAVSDAAVLKRLSPEAQGHVQVADLKKLCPEMKIEPLGLYYSEAMAGPWIYCDAGEIHMARWPNKEWTDFTKAVDLGGFSYENTKTDPAQGGAFQYKTDRAARWDIDRGDVFVEGYLSYDWHDERVAIKRYDPNGVIHLAYGTTFGVSPGGWALAQRRFRILNALSELDEPGEWYIDRQTGQLYVWPLKEGTVHYYLLSGERPLIHAKEVKGIDFIGLGVKYGYEAFRMEDCSDCNLRNLDISYTVGDAVTLTGDHITVSDCEIAYVGCRCLMITGGDRPSLTNGEIVVENCHLHHYSCYKYTYKPAVGLYGCGNVVRNNYIHDAPHTAILYGGNEHTIERNEICNVLKQTGDAGVIYAGRDWTMQGVKIRHNYIHDIIPLNPEHNSSMAIYIDDCGSGTTIQGNILLRISRGMMIGGGRDNLVHGNAMIGCNIGLSMDARGMTWSNWNTGPHWNLEEMAEELHYRESPWKDRYPNLARTMEDSPREPLHNELVDNLFYTCKKDIEWDDAIVPVLHKLTIKENISVNDSILAIDKLTLDDLKGWADQYELFRSIPMDSIGLFPR